MDTNALQVKMDEERKRNRAKNKKKKPEDEAGQWVNKSTAKSISDGATRQKNFGWNY